MSESTKKNNTTLMIMVAIAALMGLYLAFIAPRSFDTTMSQLIMKQTKQATAINAGHLSRLYVGSIYSGIEILVGLSLITVSLALYKGLKWAWPMTMLLLAIPAMVNGYIGLGWLENLKQYPPAYNTFFLSLVAFWAMLLLKENDKKTKVALFTIYTLLGMLGSQGFMLFPHALRVIMKDPAAALLDPAASVLLRTGPVMFLVVIFAGLAIWKLSQEKASGWYLAVITGLLMIAGAFPAHYARPLVASLVSADTLEASIFTSTYWMAGAQGVLLVVLLLIPFFMNRLQGESTTSD